MLLHGMTIFTLFFHAVFRTRTRNRAIVGVSLSILMHASLLLVLQSALQPVHVHRQADSPPEPFEVVFVQPRPEPPPAVRHTEKPEPPPRQPARMPSSLKPSRAVASPSPPAMTQAPPEMDISAMLDAARERRRAAEDVAARENAQARAIGQPPSVNDIARANIAFQEHKARGGASGVFEIISKGPRVAQYVFRGWTTDARHSQRRTITVDAPDGDVEKAIVDSMIALIREYYSGDFNWDSRRLGRIVSLSARQADTAGLQAFLLREFFD